jgi:D-glycerate 3-kinase
LYEEHRAVGGARSPLASVARLQSLVLPALDFTFRAFAGRSVEGPLVLGLSGPQGCGKSTLAADLVAGFGWLGLRATCFSVDDVYLRRDEQVALAERFPGAAIFADRGFPGTHDVELGCRVLDGLSTVEPGQFVRVPSYDKSAFGGRGDRKPHVEWPEIACPLDLVVFEGWMLGFTPAAEPSDPALAQANEFLRRYEVWHERLGAFLHLDAAEPHFVVSWRVEAERRRRESGAPGLSDAEAEDYVRRFLPGYALWGPALRERAPVQPSLRLVMGPDRLPYEQGSPLAV